MTKQASRRIPYRVYKNMFSDCIASEYDSRTKSIMVTFPADYIESKFAPSDGWKKECNHADKSYGKTSYGHSVWATVCEFSDGGCKYYDAYVTAGNTYAGGSEYSKHYVRSYRAAEDWANAKAHEIINR